MSLSSPHSPCAAGGVADRVVAWGRERPDRVAIDFYGDAWTYQRLASSIETWAGRCAAAGIGPGSTVLVFLPQGPEAIALYFGVMLARAVPSFMPLPSPKQNPQHYWQSHRQLLELIRPATVVTLQTHRDAMLESGFDGLVGALLAADGDWPATPGTLPPIGDPDRELALLQHSSGTTALKKGVALSHAAVGRQVDAYARALGAHADDVVVSWLPIYHDMGLIACTIVPLMLGQKLVLLDPFLWVAEPRSLLDALSAHRGTLTWLPNFAFELLAKTVRFEPGALDLSSVRAFIDCSEPCKPSSFDRFLARFHPAGVRAESLQVCYAMAETVFAVTQTALGQPVRRIQVDAARLAETGEVHEVVGGLALLSAGTTLDGMRVRILDENGFELPAGRVGEIHLASEFLFDGYLKRPELTAAKLRDGWYATADVGFLHDEHLYVLGRLDDLIIVHGRNYFAHEVEAIVNELPGLKAGRNVAVGVFNDAMGSQEMVVIAEEDGASDSAAHLQLRRRVKHAVNEHMGLDLRDVRIVAPGWLAKTTSGKISRSLNRDKYLREQQSAGLTAQS